MPIEFRCTQCDKLLRTKDETSGKQARCPQCGAILKIPAAGHSALPAESPLARSAAPPPLKTAHSRSQSAPQRAVGAPGDVGLPAQAAVNPYGAPLSSASPTAHGDRGPLQNTPLELGDVFRRTWSIFTNHLGLCIVLGLLPMLLMGCGFGAVAVLSAIATLILRSPLAAVGVMTLGVLSLSVFFVWLHVGLLHTFLKIARGEQASLGDLFSGGPWLTVLLAGLVFSIVVGVGYLLLFVPGVILALMLWPFPFLIIERNLGAIESLKSASEITQGNKLAVLGVFVVFVVANALIGGVTLGLGYLLTTPFFILMQAVMYLLMTGQPTFQAQREGA